MKQAAWLEIKDIMINRLSNCQLFLELISTVLITRPNQISKAPWNLKIRNMNLALENLIALQMTVVRIEMPFMRS